MAAKQSQEMRNALALVAAGTPIRQAARESCIHWTSLHRAIKKAATINGSSGSERV